MQPLYLLIVAVALVALGTAEVMNDFSSCIKYFFGEKPPTGFEKTAFPVPEEHLNENNVPECLAAYQQSSPAYICQKIPKGNQYYFATLYDRGRRIPLYSAYLVQKGKPCGERPGFFRLEPQLIHRELSAESQQIQETKNIIKNYNNRTGCNPRFEENRETHKIKQSQAFDDDYNDAAKQGYDRGHLNPRQHHNQEEFCDSTFTFTNVVAMNKELNNKIWNKHEIEIKEIMESHCEQMYVITGAVPDNDKKVNNRVYVPSHIWSAYCCVNNKGLPIKSGGVLVRNNNNAQKQTMTVNKLEEELGKLYNQEIKLIDGCQT
ncbi:endonuclease domain-containing 1 protein-like isoform X3 [Erpetoichthys calabaricus]|uniref:endonuclease domain-containing 1 protein-like isoform X3 n=1 Tax=Erpetoichthys calabaricus TaxID=27687 RepID=UPI0022348936|nr:endonuclease domain-containing 1 protein-like isoform X3 [Erpetoichthys calabaricus]